MMIEKEIVTDERILKTMMDATKTGISGQFLVLVFTILVLYPYVPSLLLGGWASIQLLNLLVRVKIVEHFFKVPSEANKEERKKVFHRYIASLVFTAFLWALMDLFIFYLPQTQWAVIAVFVISLTFGATMALGAATRIYLLFVLPMNILLFSIFLYFGIKEQNLILSLLALFLPVTLLFAIKVAKMHLSDYRALLEKEEELRRQKHLYKYRATHDALTDLPNRQLFYTTIENEIRTARFEGESFALLFIDLNDFKKINDTYGHRTGDTLLKNFSKRLKYAVRESDFIARLAGDEFVILIRNISSREEAERIVEKIRAIGDHPFSLRERHISVRLSVGYALFPEDAVTVEELIHDADSKMYREKRILKSQPVVVEEG